MGEEEIEARKDYEESIQWLRKHVPLDDIYEFAHQMLSNSEFLIVILNKELDLIESMKQDDALRQCIANVCNIHRLKKQGFQGILNITPTWKE